MYNISDIEYITGDNDYGRLLIFIKGQNTAIECNLINFDHKNGTFSIS